MCASDKILAQIRKQFNAFLEAGMYPKAWNHALIVTILKLGDKAESANYRGITINNSLSKLFSVCIQKRVDDHL